MPRPIARSLARARARKAARKLPRSYRYQNAPQPPDGPILKYRLAMRWLVNKWWAKAGPQALAAAQRIGKHTDEESDEADALDVALTDFSYVATEPAFAARVNSAATAVDNHSIAQFKRIGIKLSKADPGVSKLVPGFRKDNVALVTTMFKQEKSKLEQLLRDGSGRRVESLAADIQDRFDITTRHAELIARDQCLKLNANISHERMQNAGITKFVWTTAGDERVRPDHDDLDGETFSFDDPPVTNSDGDTNLPGGDFQCRCVAFPVDDVLDDTESSDDEPAAADDAAVGDDQPSASEPDDSQLQYAGARSPASQSTERQADPAIARSFGKLTDALSAGSQADQRAALRDIVKDALPNATTKDVTLKGALKAKAHVLETNGSLISATGADAIHSFDGNIMVDTSVLNRAKQGDPDALRVLIHEELHGHSRATLASYKGAGMVLEEVGTELHARAAVLKLNPAAEFSGAYQEWIDSVVNIVQGAADDTERKTTMDRVYAAHEKVTAAGPRFASEHEALDAFVSGLDLTPEAAQYTKDALFSTFKHIQ